MEVRAWWRRAEKGEAASSSEFVAFGWVQMGMAIADACADDTVEVLEARCSVCKTGGRCARE